jgi:Mce-associated membrane protein
VILAALVIATVLGAVGLLGGQSWSEARDTRSRAADWEAGDSAPAAAERAAAAILSYDHRTLDADRDSALKFMTSDFGAKYKETFDKVVAPTARETSARVAADVKASAIIRATDGRVRVLVFVDQSTESTVSETPRSALNRVEMVMVRESGSWLVDDITSY